jgi:hypothetical protein
VALELDVKPIAENALELLGARAGKLAIAFGEASIDRSFKSAAERDETFRPRGQIGNESDRLPGFARSEMGRGREIHEIGIALRVLGEQRDAPIGLRHLMLAARERACR